MKTRIILACLIVSVNLFSQTSPVSVSQSGNTITVSFTLPVYALKDTTVAGLYANTSEVFKLIGLDGFGIIDDVGYPQLPQLTLDLNIPKNSSNYAVSVSGQVTQQITLNQRIFPTQEDVSGDDTQMPPFQLNQSYYASNGSLYQHTHQLSDPYIVFGEGGIALTIFPFQYNPQTNKITVLKQATFTFSYSGGMIPSSPSPSSSVKEEYLSGFFSNYQKPGLKSGGNDFGGRYLMITGDDLATALAPFAAYKRNLGYEVNVEQPLRPDPPKKILKRIFRGNITMGTPAPILCFWWEALAGFQLPAAKHLPMPRTTRLPIFIIPVWTEAITKRMFFWVDGL